MKSLGLVLAVLVGSLVAQQPMSQVRDMGHPGAKRPMTFADLMAMKRVSDPQVSPGGKWVMFSVTEVSLERNSKVTNLWVVPLGGGGETPTSQKRDVGHPSAERQLTFGDGEANGRFSPDGRWVSLTMKDQVWRMSWDEAAGTVGTPVQVTQVDGGADGAVWSPDSKRLLFVVSVYPECSDKSGWAEEDACDKARQEAADKSPVKAQLWTGLLYRHWDHYTGERRSHVAVVNADGSGLRDLTPVSVVGDAETPTFSLGGPLGYAWAPDGKEIAYVANLDAVPAASTNNDVFTLRLDEPGAKAVKVSTSLGSDDGPQYSPDGKWLAFRSQARAGYESDRFRLMVVDRNREKIEEVIPKFNGWIDDFMWAPDSAAIVFTSGKLGMELIYSVNVIPNHDPKTDPTLVGLSGDGEYADLRVLQARDGNLGVTVVATKMSASSPNEVVQIDAGMLGHTFYDKTMMQFGKIPDPKETGELVEVSEASWDKERTLTRINATRLRQMDLSPLNYFWFTGAEGEKAQAFLVKPPNFDPKKKYPVKFLIHGGPQGAWGDAWSYRWNPELMAASGYVVVMVNPRGSTGYGQAFIDGVNGDWGGKAYVDLMRGLDAAEKQFPFIDKDRECALGASYGGFMANWILTHTNRFKCIVTHDGMYNPAAAYGDTEEMWFNEWEFRRRMPDGSLDTEPASPWRYASLPADQDPFRRWSPMLHIQDAKTPTLVIHSQRDYRLDVSEGFQLFTALQRLHVPSEMLYFPDEGHWVLKPQNSELWNKTVSDWCDKWTKN